MFNSQQVLEITGFDIGEWPRVLAAVVFVLVRISGLFVFAPIFNSPAIPMRMKTMLALSVALLLAPSLAHLSKTDLELNMSSIMGELSVGLVYGLSFSIFFEILGFAGMLIGMQFSFSLVNLLDPNTMVETPVMSQLFTWLGIITLMEAGLHRVVLASIIRTFAAVPPGEITLRVHSASVLCAMAGGIFLCGVQLAAPLMAAALAIEVTISLIGRISPQLPAMVFSIPIKTAVSYIVLVGSLGIWPGWIQNHFTLVLHAAEDLVVRSE